VWTIDRVAADLDESIDRLHDVAMQMDAEAGVIRVYGLGDGQIIAFTEFAVETLVGPIKDSREPPRSDPQRRSLRPTPDAYVVVKGEDASKKRKRRRGAVEPNARPYGGDPHFGCTALEAGAKGAVSRWPSSGRRGPDARRDRFRSHARPVAATAGARPDGG
jgi:hypothetical protein